MPLPPIYTQDNYRPTRNAGRSLVDIASALSAAVDRRAAPLGISGAQWVVLMRISGGNGISAAELCRNMGYDSGSMTRMLDRLERRGLILRERSDEDRRIIRLYLTDLGRDLYPQWTPIALATLNELLDGFTAAEAETLMGFLDRIRANQTKP